MGDCFLFYSSDCLLASIFLSHLSHSGKSLQLGLQLAFCLYFDQKWEAFPEHLFRNPLCQPPCILFFSFLNSNVHLNQNTTVKHNANKYIDYEATWVCFITGDKFDTHSYSGRCSVSAHFNLHDSCKIFATQHFWEGFFGTMSSSTQGKLFYSA